MPQLTNWFGEPITIPDAPKPDPNVNPCIAVYGAGPDGKLRSDCSHLVGICKAKTYYKCDLRQNTHGPKSDHSGNGLLVANLSKEKGRSGSMTGGINDGRT